MSVISIVILFMILVKDIDGTQDDNPITLTVLFNHIVTSPNAGKVLIDNALELLRNQTDVPINMKYIEFFSSADDGFNGYLKKRGYRYR